MPLYPLKRARKRPHPPTLTEKLTKTIEEKPERLEPITLPQLINVGKNRNKTFINPLTGYEVINNWNTRDRLKKAIEKYNNEVVIPNNRKYEEFDTINNKLKNTRIITNREDTGFFKYILELNNIESIEQLYNALKQLIYKVVKNNEFIVEHYALSWVNEENQAETRTFTPDNLVLGYEYFKNSIEEMEQGTDYGSDPINTNENKLFYNRVVIYVQQIDKANGISSKIIYKIVDVNSIKGNKKDRCLFNSLKYINIVEDGNDDFNGNIDMFLSHINKYNININVVSNVITKLKMSEIMTNNTPIISNITINKKVRRIALYKLSENDFIRQYRHRASETAKNLIYCPISKHIDVLNGFELNDIYTDTSGTIYKINCDNIAFKLYEGDIINEERKIINHEPIIETLYYLFLDYETIIDFYASNCMKPYALSFFYYSHTELLKISGYADGLITDFDIEEKTTKAIYEDKNRCKNIIGFNCNHDFIKWFVDFQRNKKIVIVSYNGANFDNFLLYSGICEYLEDFEDDIYISNVLFNGNQLLDFKINNTHHLYDLNRFIAGKLIDNCEAFNVPERYKKIKGFDHQEIQKLYDNSTKEDFIKNMKANDNLECYNNNDVKSLSIIFCKWFKSIAGLKEDFEFGDNLYNFTNKITIGGLGYSAFKKNHKINKIKKLPKVSIEQYQLIQKYKVAGRVDLFNKPNNKINEKCAGVDCCSMYPYSMCVAPNYYPYGDIKKASKYFKPNKYIGWYKCDIYQENLKALNLPPIYCNKIFKNDEAIENDFESYEPLIGYFINNVEIEHIRKYGCRVDIRKCEENFYFTDKIKGCELFKFVLNWMKLKNQQDIYKKTNKELYNSSMRETYKLLMNCISGKVIEGLHTEKIEVLTSREQYKICKAKNEIINVINEIGDDIYISYKIDEAELINKQKPIYLGCLIYTYSRGYMYDNIISKVGCNKCLYMDTDSIAMREADFIAWREYADKTIVPHWPEVEKYDERYKEHTLYNIGSKVFGSFENELEDNNINYYLQKKTHAHFMKTDNEIKYCKIRVKGVQRNSILLNGDEDFIRYDDNKKVYMKCKADDLINNYCINNKDLEIGVDFKIDSGILRNQYKFFEDLHINKSVNVLCRGIKKSVKNSNRLVEIDEEERYNKHNNTIQASFIIKRISIN